MPANTRNCEISLLLYPDVLLAAVHGLTDLFRVANRIAGTYSPKKGTPATLRVTHWQLSAKKGKGVERTYDSHPGLSQSRPLVVIVPPSLGDPLPPETSRQLARWLTTQHAAGAALCSVCSGAFLLAETGLLAGRVATTHWTYANEFARRFPDIQVEADQIVVDDGDIMTAGGVMAWTDLGLKIIDRLLGPTVMLETARFMLIDPPGREQRYYSHFSPVLLHGDQAVLKVQHWLQAHAAQDVDVPAMAARAGLEERTFLRRFRKATGLKPTEYCQQLRVGKAREKLEFTKQNVDEIAWAVGYEDAGAFRKVFRKVVGLTPGEYRSRFNRV